MKRTLLIVALLLMLCGIVRADMTVWGLYDRDTAGARIGYVNKNIELGLFGAWRPDPKQPPNLFGIYSLYEFDAVEVANLIPIDWLPATLSGKPYIGGFLTIDFERDQARALGGPMVGLLLQDVLAIELRYQLVNDQLEQNFQNQQYVLSIGPKFRF
jgi:hypothetical protein